ncbi:MAG: response regulator transcription factor [Bacteroidaceae bacterium]|nr:response regulator transcription factor [Bacteroidaceae bacterium]
MYKIIIADDHLIVTEGVTRIIQEIRTLEGEPFGDVIATVNSLDECQLKCQELQPDLLLLDVAMGDGDGIDRIKEVQKAAPAMKIIILTIYAEPAVVSRAIAAGTDGYVVKTADINEFSLALRMVMNGDTYVSKDARTLAKDHPYGMGDNGFSLTRREKDVLGLLAKGYTMKEIASELCLSFETVHSYTKYLREKLHANNTASMVRIAIENHLI